MNEPHRVSRLYEFRRLQEEASWRAAINRERKAKNMVEWGMERWQSPKRPSRWLALAIVVWLAGLLFLLGS